MSRSQNVQTLMRLPLARIHTVAKIYCSHLVPGTDKLTICEWLEARINSGQITLADITGVTTAAPVAPAATVAQSVNAAALATGLEAITAVGAVANRAETLALDAALAAAAAGDAAKALETRTVSDLQDLTLAVNKMQRARDTQVNDALVAVAVADAVASAFKPFHAAVIAAGASSAVGAMVSARIVDRKTAESVFGVRVVDYKGQDVMVDLWNDASCPAIDDCFIWTDGILKSLLLAQDDGCNLWFGGDRGTGKSEVARQFAARTGRAYTRINFHKHTSSEDYIGAVGLVNGATEFVKGDFLQAFTSPSTVILLDEVSNCDAGELAPLNGFLESNSAVTWGGSVHRRGAGVIVLAADNTLGNGDDSGRYAGTRPMNSALIDRFAVIVPFTFLPLAVEVEAVTRHTGCSAALAEHILSAITAARAKVQSGDIVDAPSIRSVIGFIRALKRHSVQDAWDLCVASRQPSEGASALAAIYAAYIHSGFISKHI
jgi:MoxR-like ATPase